MKDTHIDIFPRIDAISHIMPPKVAEFLARKDIQFPRKHILQSSAANYDLNIRFQSMDLYPDIVQVINFPMANSLEEITKDPKLELELAQRINDGIAELVDKYPNRFVGGLASLPMSNMDVAMKELDRAINDLRLRGVTTAVPISGKAPDLPEFMPLYEFMSQCNLPIFLHGTAPDPKIPNYVDESESKYGIWVLWGYIISTSNAVVRLVFSGVLEKYPNLKLILHQAGGMVPFFSQRIEHFYDNCDRVYKYDFTKGLSKAPIEYFRMFYGDTCVSGSTNALMCAYNFFGAEHLLFGTDLPYHWHFKMMTKSIEQMDIPEYEKKLIFGENARQLMRLAIP